MTCDDDTSTLGDFGAEVRVRVAEDMCAKFGVSGAGREREAGGEGVSVDEVWEGGDLAGYRCWIWISGCV